MIYKLFSSWRPKHAPTTSQISDIAIIVGAFCRHNVGFKRTTHSHTHEHEKKSCVRVWTIRSILFSGKLLFAMIHGYGDCQKVLGNPIEGVTRDLQFEKKHHKSFVM